MTSSFDDKINRFTEMLIEQCFVKLGSPERFQLIQYFSEDATINFLENEYKGQESIIKFLETSKNFRVHIRNHNTQRVQANEKYSLIVIVGSVQFEDNIHIVSDFHSNIFLHIKDNSAFIKYMNFQILDNMFD